MYAPLCGEEPGVRSYPTPPRGVLIPHTAQARTEGLGCVRRSVGRNWESYLTRPPHVAPLSPKRPRQGRRDSGVFADVWGGDWESDYNPHPPPGPPSPLNGSGKNGETRVYPLLCGEKLDSYHSRPPNGASRYPKRPKQDRRDSGVCAAVWGETRGPIIPDPPTGRPYP